MRIFFNRNSPLTDEQLMRKIQRGSSEAFDELYQRYSRRMLLYFQRMLGGDTDKAQDFLQDLFIKIIDKCNLFRARAKFSTWVFSVAHNMCKNEYRRLQVRRMIDHTVEPDGVAGVTDNAYSDLDCLIDHHHLKKLISKELKKFDDNQRSTFILRFQEQMSIREISEILDCGEGTTKSRIFYVTKKLSRALGDYNPQKKSEVA